MNEVKFEAKNNYTVNQYWLPRSTPQVPLAVAKFSDLGRLLPATCW